MRKGEFITNDELVSSLLWTYWTVCVGVLLMFFCVGGFVLV